MCITLENFPKSQTLFDTISESSPIAQFFGKKNVAMSNGHDWKNQRKVCLFNSKFNCTKKLN